MIFRASNMKFGDRVFVLDSIKQAFSPAIVSHSFGGLISLSTEMGEMTVDRNTGAVIIPRMPDESLRESAICIKIRYASQAVRWEDIPIDAVLYKTNSDGADSECDLILQYTGAVEARWNYLHSHQGHYVYRTET